MPSIHIPYKDWKHIEQIVTEARKLFDGRAYRVRDLYDNYDYGVMSFDFEEESDAMLFKLKYGGKYRPNG